MHTCPNCQADCYCDQTQLLSYDPPTDCYHDCEETAAPFDNLGSCCVCGVEGSRVRNIMMLHKRSLEPGKGWGCVQCGLPMDGAYGGAL